MKTVLSVCAAAMVASTAGAGIVNDWNLIVLNNLSGDGDDIEGTAFIGGNFVSSGSPVLAKNLNAGAYAGVTTVAVGGNFSAINVNMQAGNLRYGGTFSGNFNPNGGGNRAQDGSIPGMVAGYASQLTGLSTFYRGLTTNSSVTVPGGQPAPVIYTSGAPSGGVAVFNVAAASVFNSGLIQQIELNAGNASAIVINVSGTSVNYSNGNMVGGWQTNFARTKVIWNFWEATSIAVNRNFNGAILAPFATLTNSTAIDGSVFVGAMNQNGEVHLPLFTGYVPAPAGASLIAGAGLLALRRRR